MFLGGASAPPPPTAPGAPTGLITTPASGQVVLSWTAPASTGGSPITGYTATASPGGATCASATLGCTIGGLTNGTSYSFTVRATNAVGTGPASAAASATPNIPPGTLPVDNPGVQGSWVGTYGQDGYILANWDGNNTDLANLPTGVTYTLEQGARATWVSPTADVRALQNPAGTERRAQTWYDSATIRLRLNFANAYSGTLHLYAVDWDAYGGNRFENVTVNDGSGNRVAQLTSSFVPGAWIHAPITVAAGGSVLITVDKTAGYSAVLAGLFLGGGSPPPPPPPTLPVDSPGAQGSWVGTYGHDGYILANWNGNSTDLSSLPAGVTYALEAGARATWVSPTTDVRALTSPAGTERRAQTWYDPNLMRLRLSFANAYSGTLHLYAVDWDAWGGNRYENITIDDGSGPRVAHLTSSFVPGAWIHAPVSISAGGSVVITVNLISGNSAVLAGVFLGGANPPPPPTVPGAPTGLAATPGNAQVVLAWTAPASNGGSAITGYTATASPGGATCTTSTLGCTIGSLTNGTPYSFTVTASNTVGTGPASAPASATPVAPATVPGAPTGLTATPGNAQVVLAWTAPASNGGSAITGYTATASPGGGTCSTATLGCTIGSLTNGTPYTFTVIASNAVGPGPASAPASATPVAPAIVPGAPTGLAATPGNAQVVLAWTAPASNGGSPITGYRIYRGTVSGGATLLATVGVVTTFTDPSLTNGTTYFYQVAARNAVGDGSRSVEVSARPRTVPGAPRNLTATRSATLGVNLSWAAPTSNGGSPVTGYRIYRSTTTGTETFLVAVGNVTSYVDTATTPGVRYFYKVSAINVAGEGPRSAEANARAR